MILALTNPSLHLRPIGAKDEDMLCQIYSATRTEELSVTDWSTEKKQTFLRLQFQAQHTYYQINYDGADFLMIEYDGQPIGRLYVDRNFEHNSIRIIDISLLPQWRSKGIGRQILQDLIEYAASRQKPVTIHVESFNRAMNLYLALGFQLLSVTNGVYHLLEWKIKEPVLQ